MTRRELLLLLVSGAWAAGANAAPVVEAVPAGELIILLEQQRAVIRESISVMIPEAGAVVQVPFFPAEADPSSLSILDRRREVRLLEWRLPPSPGRGGMKAATAGRLVKVDLDPVPSWPSSGVELSLQSASAGSKRFDIVYIITGLSWKVTYDVLLRGDLRDITSPMSIDVEGWVEISNSTQRSFRDARVVLVGADTLGYAPEPKEPGFLDLDENTPLADMWRYQKREPQAAHFYSMDGRITLPAGETKLDSLVSVTRKPVDRIFVLRAEDIPTDTQSQFAMPQQIIQFKNAADYGGNRAVPPGRAMIHVGSQRSALYQQAWFKHTPAQGDISLDMGKLPGIRARRVDRGRREMAGGYLEHVFELRIDNTFDKPVQVIVDEQPPLSLSWSPLRANQPYEQRDRRLVFNPKINAKTEVTIQYTLRVEIPKN